MKCPKCGKSIDAIAGMKFCPFCAAPLEEKKTTVTGPALGALSTGSRVKFGRYPQASSVPEPIEWRVLVGGKTRALLISKYLLDGRKYNETCNDVTWETCTLRKWLNNDFLRAAFTAEEQARLLLVSHINIGNAKHEIPGGNTTADKVFCLTIEETEKYLPTFEDRRAAPTKYAMSRGAESNEKVKLADGRNAGWWWLRTPGMGERYVSIVLSSGEINKNGNFVDIAGYGVRPAVWISL